MWRSAAQGKARQGKGESRPGTRNESFKAEQRLMMKPLVPCPALPCPEPWLGLCCAYTLARPVSHATSHCSSFFPLFSRLLEPQSANSSDSLCRIDSVLRPLSSLHSALLKQLGQTIILLDRPICLVFVSAQTKVNFPCSGHDRHTLPLQISGPLHTAYCDNPSLEPQPLSLMGGVGTLHDTL